MPRLTPVLFVSLTSACISEAVSSPVDPPPPAPASRQLDEAARLAELPSLHAYRVHDDTVQPTRRWGWDRPTPPWPDGVLVAVAPGEPPLATGDRLAVVQGERDLATVVVTDERCPPTAIDCLLCNTRWATRVAGPVIDKDAVLAIVGPLAPGTFEIATPSAEHWSIDDGLVVTHDGVQLVESRVCDRKQSLMTGTCVTTTEFVLGQHRRELSRWSAPLRGSLQLFRLLAWPGTSILTGRSLGGRDDIGGPEQIVIGQWSGAPDVPIRDASYWLVGPKGMVGSVRFDPPYVAAHCSFMSNPCWSTTVVGLPSSDDGVWLVVGPIDDSSPEPISQARLEIDEGEQTDLVLGAPEQPWATLTSRGFACHEDDGRSRDHGWCVETVITIADGITRRVSYQSVEVHHSNPETICFERSDASASALGEPRD